MEPELIGWLTLAAMFLLLGLGVPVAFVLAGLGFGVYLLLAGVKPALGIVPITFYGKTALYAFTAVPLFILMGHFAFYAGFGGDIYNTARQWVGRLPGGLARGAAIRGGRWLGADLLSAPALPTLPGAAGSGEGSWGRDPGGL